MAETPTDPILWLPQVADHDYAAAGSYLSLLHPEGEVDRLLDRLKARARSSISRPRTSSGPRS